MAMSRTSFGGGLSGARTGEGLADGLSGDKLAGGLSSETRSTTAPSSGVTQTSSFSSLIEIGLD